MTTLKVKRAYEPSSTDDGYRVYIDRLWPRGLSHETFHYDVWDKNIAPSNELRQMFHTNPDANWSEFEKDYEKEFATNPARESFIAQLEQHSCVTLLYSSHNETENNALVLQHILLQNYPDKFRINQ